MNKLDAHDKLYEFILIVLDKPIGTFRAVISIRWFYYDIEYFGQIRKDLNKRRILGCLN